MAPIDILVAVPRERAKQYHQHFSSRKDFRIHLVSDARDVLDLMADRDRHINVCVVDNTLDKAHQLIGELRHTYPRLLIVLVDEEADFGTPGQADDISTEPFAGDDLIRRINRLLADRELETLRADSLPAVRQFAKRLRGAATGEIAKYEAAVLACSDLGFDYVAFYRLESTDPLRLSLRAQSGPAPAQAAAPKQASAQDIVGWVAQNGQTRFAGPGDEFTYALVTSGHMGAAICLPVSSNVTRYGVLVACRQQPDSITQEHVLMLELISVQLAAAISKENIG